MSRLGLYQSLTSFLAWMLATALVRQRFDGLKDGKKRNRGNPQSTKPSIHLRCSQAASEAAPGDGVIHSPACCGNPLNQLQAEPQPRLEGTYKECRSSASRITWVIFQHHIPNTVFMLSLQAFLGRLAWLWLSADPLHQSFTPTPRKC